MSGEFAGQRVAGTFQVPAWCPAGSHYLLVVARLLLVPLLFYPEEPTRHVALNTFA